MNGTTEGTGGLHCDRCREFATLLYGIGSGPTYQLVCLRCLTASKDPIPPRPEPVVASE